MVFTQLDATNIGGAIAAFVSDIPGAVMSFRNYNPTHFPQWAPLLPWMELSYRTLVGSQRIRLTGNFRAANEDYARWLNVPSFYDRHDPERHRRDAVSFGDRRASFGVATRFENFGGRP